MSLSSAILARSPVGHWRLGETSGTTAADASGNSLNGTYEGSFTLGQTSLAGDANTAVAVSGGGRVNLGNPTALKIEGAITLVALVKPSSFPGNNQQAVMISKGYDNDREGYMLRFYRTPAGVLEIHFTSYNNPTEYAAKATVTGWATGETRLVVGRHLAGQHSVWVGGVKLAEETVAAGAQGNNNAPVGLGSTNYLGGWTHHFDGVIDEAAIFNYGNSDADIAVYMSELGGPPPSAAVLNSATVSANGANISATFSAAVSAVDLKQFRVTAGGKVIPLLSVTGESTVTLTFRLAQSWIAAGETVRFTYLGNSLTSPGGSVASTTVAATNSSTVAARLRKYTDREFGMFLHVTSANYGIPAIATQAQLNAFNPTSLNIDQWLDAAVAAGMKYAVLTTKHDSGFCIWPTATTPFNITQTTWYATTPIDIVREFVTKCRARGLGVGLYINFYDPWWQSVRPGADGNYGTGFAPHISTQITELLTFYGQIDILWIDSWHYRPEIGYTNVPYATILSLVNGLQPNCVLCNNARGSTTTSEIKVLEGSNGGDSPPDETNFTPAEFCETSTTNNIWHFDVATNDSTLMPALTIASRLESINRGRGSYLLNFPPNQAGTFSTAQLNLLTEIGQIVGQQGGTKLPPRPVVQLGVDRGDGETGLLVSSNGGGNIIAGLV